MRVLHLIGKCTSRQTIILFNACFVTPMTCAPSRQTCKRQGVRICPLNIRALVVLVLCLAWPSKLGMIAVATVLDLAPFKTRFDLPNGPERAIQTGCLLFGWSALRSSRTCHARLDCLTQRMYRAITALQRSALRSRLTSTQCNRLYVPVSAL